MKCKELLIFILGCKCVCMSCTIVKEIWPSSRYAAYLFLGARRRKGLSDIFSTQFNSKHPFHLAQNDVIRDATTSFIVRDDLLLLVNFRRELLLTEALCLSSLLDVSSDIGVDRLVL